MNNNKDNKIDNNEKSISSENSVEKVKLLLDLSLHRYEEEERRNELIDNKNQSLVAFLGVMLTIQCTLLPNIVDLYEVISIQHLIFLILFFSGSIISYCVSILFFVNALTYGEFKSAPSISTLIKFGKDDNKNIEDNIIPNTIISLNDAIAHNNNLLIKKTNKGKFGFISLIIGIFCTLIFIILFLII